MRVVLRALALSALLLTLGACGSRHSQPTPVASTTPAVAPAAAPTPKAPAAAPVAQEENATANGAQTGDEESVSDQPLSISPIAKAVAAASGPAAAAISAKWVDGQNYTTLVPAQPTDVSPDKVEVVEVFWYGCPHCFDFDPYLEDWRKRQKSAYVEFKRMPVIWNETTKAHARLYFTMEALGKLEELHTLVFREIHVNHNPLVGRDADATAELQKAFLVAHGVKPEDVDRTYRSFSVESKLGWAEQMTQRYRATGVPLMVINGKYTADIGSAGGPPQLIALINDLASAEHRR